MSAPVECIANPGNNGEPEVPLWECPCRECWALECASIHAANDGAHPDDVCEVPTYSRWLAELSHPAT